MVFEDIFELGDSVFLLYFEGTKHSHNARLTSFGRCLVSSELTVDRQGTSLGSSVLCGVLDECEQERQNAGCPHDMHGTPGMYIKRLSDVFENV